MKQFLLMLAMMPLASFAQDGYRPLVEQGKKWTYHHDTYQYVYDYHYTLEGDTVVAGKDCLKMYSENRYGVRKTRRCIVSSLIKKNHRLKSQHFCTTSTARLVIH